MLLRECVNLLLEGVPAGMSLDAVRDEIAGVEGVATVHDLHLWAITQSQPMLTAHRGACRRRGRGSVRRAIEARLHERYDLHHTTLQMERDDRSVHEAGH